MFFFVMVGAGVFNSSFSHVQNSFPPPPADHALVYVLDEKNALIALPFEVGQTPLDQAAVARSDKRGYVELKGERAASIIHNYEPRFFLFVKEGEHPPFLVHLETRRGARRVAAFAQKGQRGFAIDSAQIIKPRINVLSREAGGLLYMEIIPRDWLMPGEYAFVGSDLRRIATFRVAAASNR